MTTAIDHNWTPEDHLDPMGTVYDALAEGQSVDEIVQGFIDASLQMGDGDLEYWQVDKLRAYCEREAARLAGN
ncbi:MAG TPA: hypothetical protein VM011_03820 [Gammaproteobacteria bacterium]|nr:hypothetical protein [Gammaproteobacteria bacterium]